MDTSETYIKMRRGAIPYLGIGKPPELIPYVEVTWLTALIFIDRNGNCYYSSEDETFQLERQDQAQEMVGETTSKMLSDFIAWQQTFSAETFYRDDYKKQFTSMEQLWFVFMMKQCYSKVWNGTEWYNAIG